MQGKQRSLLLINESSEVQVKLKLYAYCDPVCYIPHTSKVINPKDKLFCTSKWGCKLELVARFTEKKQPKKVLLRPQQWVGKRYVKITASLDVIEDDLSNHEEEEKEALRKKNRDQELEVTDGKRNLYSILRLDMDEVRKMSKDEQDKEIDKAFLRELQIWHPDHNKDGDDEIVRELILAYDTLKDREKRAQYNNLADKGWLSGKRFKAVFWPECETVAQRSKWLKRMGLLALSAGLTVGDIVSVVLTAGFSSPFLVCAVAGGLKSLRETISKEAVVDGCDVEKWLMSTGVGYLLALLPGGAAIGTAILETGAVTVGELIGIKTSIAGGCAFASSLTVDAKKRFIDGEKITWKKALGHATCKCTAAVLAILAGVAVAKALNQSSQTTTKVPNLKPAVKETGDKISQLPGSTIPANVEGAVVEIGEQGPLSLPVQAKALFARFEAPLTEVVTKTAIEKAGEFAEKHSDDLSEKISSLPHEVVIEKAAELLDNLERPQEDNHAGDSESTQKLVDGVMKYLSKGLWFSKMVVSYLQDEQRVTKEVRGSGKQIKIPSPATKIEVCFKILRPPWGYIVKYDRFKRCWCEPKEPHVFHYPTPVTRTFTIEGTLWWEAVMKITDEHHVERCDM